MAVHPRLALLNALRHLRTNGPVLPEYGVLWNVWRLTDSPVEIKLLRLLQQYYGAEYNPLLPTAHDCVQPPTDWSQRVALLNWLIDTLTKEQETHQPWPDLL